MAYLGKPEQPLAVTLPGSIPHFGLWGLSRASAPLYPEGQLQSNNHHFTDTQLPKQPHVMFTQKEEHCTEGTFVVKGEAKVIS